MKIWTICECEVLLRDTPMIIILPFDPSSPTVSISRTILVRAVTRDQTAKAKELTAQGDKAFSYNQSLPVARDHSR